MEKTLIVLFVALFGITINTAAQTKDEKAKTAIRRVLDAQTTAWNAGDIDGFMRGYWNSPELVFVSGDSITKGWQPTLDRYKKSYDTKAKMGALSFSELEIFLTGKDSAVVLGRFTLVREKDKPTGLFTLNFRRFKEGWRIILDHTS